MPVKSFRLCDPKHSMRVVSKSVTEKNRPLQFALTTTLLVMLAFQIYTVIALNSMMQEELYTSLVQF